MVFWGRLYEWRSCCVGLGVYRKGCGVGERLDFVIILLVVVKFRLEFVG